MIFPTLAFTAEYIFATDQEAGADLGRAIGTAFYKNNLRPVHDADQFVRAQRAPTCVIRRLPAR